MPDSGSTALMSCVPPRRKYAGIADGAFVSPMHLVVNGAAVMCCQVHFMQSLVH